LQSNTVNDVFIYDITKDSLDYTTWYNDSTASWWQEANDTIYDSSAWKTAGTANYVTLPGMGLVLDDNKNFTLQFWIYLKNRNGNGEVVINNGWAGFYSFMSSVNRKMSCAGETSTTEFTNDIPIETWTLITWSYDGTNKTLYTNKVLNENEADAGCDNAGVNSAVIGDLHANYVSNYDMDELRFYNRSLTEAEINNSYDKGIAHQFDNNSDEGLVGYYSFNNDASDDSGNGNDGSFVVSTGMTGRSSKKEFPLKSYLIASDTGLDIIDASDNTLWYRNSSFAYSQVLALDGNVYLDNSTKFLNYSFKDDKYSDTYSRADNYYFTDSASYWTNSTGFCYNGTGLNFDFTCGNFTALNGIQDITANNDEIFAGNENGTYIFDSTSFSIDRNYNTSNVLEGSTNNTEALALNDDNITLYVGTNDGSDGGGINKIDTSTNTLLKNWTSGNNDPLVDYDITSLSLGSLLYGTTSGAGVMSEGYLQNYLDSNDCGITLDASGQYVLIDNLACSGTAITIGADKVQLDCNGYSITGKGTADSAGIDLKDGNSNSGDYVNITDCTISNFTYGVYIGSNYYSYYYHDSGSPENDKNIQASDSATNNILSGNEIHNVTYGIYVGGDFYYYYYNDGDSYGPYSSNKWGHSSNNVIANNSIYNAQYGILLYSGYDSYISDYGSHDGNDLNVIYGNSVFNTTYGIYLYLGESNNLSNNSIFDSQYGIVVRGYDSSYSSKYNLIEDNRIFNNSDYGVYLFNYSNSNNILNNSIFNNSDKGIYSIRSDLNTFSGNFIYNNSHSGVFLSYSVSNNISNNSVYNTIYGVYLEYSNNSIISNNSIFNNTQDGILIEFDSFSNEILDNEIYNNSRYGVYLYYADLSTVYNNVIRNNTLDGVIVERADNAGIISNNNLSGNGQYGIYFSYSDKGVISANNIFDNTAYGIYLYYSDSNNISNNSIFNNSGYGVYLYDHAQSNKIINNSIFNNSGGIYLRDDSDSNTISENEIYDSQYGIGLDSVYSNQIFNNNIYQMSGSGVYWGDAFDCLSNSLTISGEGNYWGYNAWPYWNYYKSHYPRFHLKRNQIQ